MLYAQFDKHYQRLRAIEPTLEPKLPENRFEDAYRAALNTVNQLQKQEIQYLRHHHQLDPNTFVLQDNMSLEGLEQQSLQLEAVNSRIILNCRDREGITLDLKRRGITRFPKQLFEDAELKDYWANLRILNLSENALRYLPDEVGHCRGLLFLFLQTNQLSCLPDTVGYCQALMTLSLRNNRLQFLPESIGNCLALETLSCSHNRLMLLPEALGKLKSLKNLYCDDNKLSFLPLSLSECLELETLNCSNNLLAVLPETLGRCQALESLLCNNNQIAILPTTLNRCRQLKTFDCRANPIKGLTEDFDKKEEAPSAVHCNGIKRR